MALEVETRQVENGVTVVAATGRLDVAGAPALEDAISEAGAVPPPTPMPRYDATAEAAVPIEPGQQTVGFSVTVVWELG